jgi:hypothetical protein
MPSRLAETHCCGLASPKCGNTVSSAWMKKSEFGQPSYASENTSCLIFSRSFSCE